MKVTLLGCGSSAGIPMIGCSCPVCLSANPKNKRSRASVLIEIKGKTLLIDTSPDLRQQALSNKISRVDAVLYTHAHADHTHGIDDLRSFNYLSGKALPVYCDVSTHDSLIKRFSYAFGAMPDVWYRPCLTPQLLPEAPVHNFTIGDISVTCFEQIHGKVKSLGFRIGSFAYSTDVDTLPEAAFGALEGVDSWIVDCLKPEKSHAHADLKTTLGWIDRVKPKRAILTHMSHEFEYEALKNALPSGVEPGYDGLVLECPDA